MIDRMVGEGGTLLNACGRMRLELHDTGFYVGAGGTSYGVLGYAQNKEKAMLGSVSGSPYL